MLAFNIVLGIILLVSFLLVLVIMVQQPKSGGLSSAFGGNAQVVGGVKKTGDFLNTSTWTLGVALIVLSLISNLILSNNRGQAQGGSIPYKDNNSSNKDNKITLRNKHIQDIFFIKKSY